LHQLHPVRQDHEGLNPADEAKNRQTIPQIRFKSLNGTNLRRLTNYDGAVPDIPPVATCGHFWAAAVLRNSG